MATEAERLVVSLEARVNQFEREMAKANRTADPRVRGIERRFQQANRSINQSLVGIGRNAFMPLAASATAALAPIALVNRALRTISDASNLVKVAERVALTTDEFQQLEFGMKQAGVEAQTFQNGMEQFADRIGEAAVRGGRLAEILEANGVALRDQDGRMRGSMSLLRDYAELIRRAGSEQEQMVLATEAFGDRAGRRFVTALRDGEAAIDDMIAATQEAGGTIDRELLKKAEELDNRLGAVWQNFSVNSRSAILTAINWLDDLLAKANEVGNASIFRRFAAGMSTFGGAELTWLDPDIARAQGQPLGPEARIRDAFRAGAVGALGEADQALIDALRQRYGAVLPEEAKTILPGGREGTSGGRSTRDRAAEAALREAEAVVRLIEGLEHERSLIGKSDVERQKANALRQAGAAATDEQREKIEQLVEAIHRETEAMEAAREAGQFFKDTMEDAFSALIPKIDTGNRALDDFLQTLIRVTMQAALFGSGPIVGRSFLRMESRT